MNDGPPAHPKGVPDLMRPQLWIDIRRALDNSQSGRSAAERDLDREPENDRAAPQPDAAGENLGAADRIRPVVFGQSLRAETPRPR